MSTVSFYDPATGLFVGRQFTGLPAYLKANTPPGLLYLPGEFDYLSQRVDLVTGEVIDYQPPQPSPDHEWDDAAKRWKLSAIAQAAIESDQAARSAIAIAEAGSARAMREGLLELLPPDSPARQKLQPVEDAIAAERPNIKRG